LSSAIVLELLLAFGVPLVWGLWQLRSIRRERAADRERDASRAEARAETRT
jgi:hypothetical protein